MNTLKNRLTNLLTLKRGADTRMDSEVDDSTIAQTQIDSEEKVGATQLESKQAANDDRPDWFQSIHDSEYYNE